MYTRGTQDTLIMKTLNGGTKWLRLGLSNLDSGNSAYMLEQDRHEQTDKEEGDS
jgi:hypothetical protein